MTFWFTSDTHFFHAKVCEYDSRPFGSLDEMNEKLIENWNSVVKKGDMVYHLGDFAITWGKDTEKINAVLERLNGQVQLICGNHDRDDAKAANFAWAGDYKSIRIDRQKIVLFHYPIMSWHHIGKGAWHLHGHCHGNLTRSFGKMMDVGTMNHEYRPISFDEVSEAMQWKMSFSPDHHTCEV